MTSCAPPASRPARVSLFYANLTNKGFVTTNLNYEYTVISLTFAGMQALKEHGNEL